MAAPDLSDPHWFPLAYEAASRRFQMVRVTLEELGHITFLDRRGLKVESRSTADVDPASILLGELPAPSFLFHTAFCGSTLLARALHAPPTAVALKEPLILHSLATAGMRAVAADERARIEADLSNALALLARPWAAGGRVLVKPANQINGWMPRILSASPRSRAILLYSDLRSFMISCFKKLPASEQRIRWMAQALLRDSQLATRLGIDPAANFNLVESCALAWYAQMERYADALREDVGSDRLRSLDFAQVLAAPADSTAACARWLQLDDDGIEGRVDVAFSRHSKATAGTYDALEREQENVRVLDMFGPTIDRAVLWANDVIAPAVEMPRWKPLDVKPCR